MYLTALENDIPQVSAQPININKPDSAFMAYEKMVALYPLQNTLFAKFCSTANQNEFLQAQTPFYHAVEAFPRFLAALAARITTTPERLKVIENLWEEHGHGKEEKFHTQSFLTYLVALGAQEKLTNKDVELNFFVDNWIQTVLAHTQSLSVAELGAYLAGIEYIYTRVSRLVINTIAHYELTCQQTHYTDHEVLDYTHAQDLLSVAYRVNESSEIGPNQPEIELRSAFSLGIQEFILMLEQLSFLTQKDCEEIAKEKIAFYYSREDSQIELSVAKNIVSKNTRRQPLSILTVCSGGEHVIQLSAAYPKARIVALDINPNQLKLTKEKIECLRSGKSLPLELNTGKFELMFRQIQKKLTLQDIEHIQNPTFLEYHVAIKKLQLVCAEVFSNNNLETIFTKEATRYSQNINQTFSNHFYEIFKSQIQNMPPSIEGYSEASNIKNVLGISLPQRYPKIMTANFIEYYHGDFPTYFNEHNDIFDMISVSNIGDWQSFEQFKNLITTLEPHVAKGGALIARKLLGDYDLFDLINENFEAHNYQDKTSFYTECVVGFKNI